MCKLQIHEKALWNKGDEYPCLKATGIKNILKDHCTFSVVSTGLLVLGGLKKEKKETMKYNFRYRSRKRNTTIMFGENK